MDTRAESAAARSKQITSTGVSSTIAQSEGQEANISAVKKDQFASSLRESSASANQKFGQQKDMAVIEQHQQRRQSSAHAAMQSTQKQSWQQQQSSRATHEVSTYGGYDHRSSGAMDYMYGSSNGAASNSDYKRWSSSAHAESRSSQQQQQQRTTQVKTAWVESAHAQQQQQYQQQFQQQRLALQQQQQQQKQQTSSYETRTVANTSAASSGRRRTWAESSALHGDSLSFGTGNSDSMRTRLIAGKLVAAHSVAQRATTSFHDEPCPAHGIYKQKSGFKYDRQTSSGHRLFLPQVSN